GRRTPRLRAHSTVGRNRGHGADPPRLGRGGASRYWAEVLAVGWAVRTRFAPVKMNYLTLGNTVPHLHTHVLPRYLDDPAPGGPVAWQDIFSPDPAPDAVLHSQAADLAALLAG